MPQGHRKLMGKRPKDVIVRADKEKLKKQAPKMKKGGTIEMFTLFVRQYSSISTNDTKVLHNRYLRAGKSESDPCDVFFTV